MAKQRSLRVWLLVSIVAATLTFIPSLSALGATTGKAESAAPYYAYLPFVRSNHPRPTPEPPPGTWHRYRLTYGIALTSYEGLTRVWMPLPVQWNTQQNIEVLGCSPEPSDDFVESEGNRVVFWERTLEGGIPSVFSERFEISSLDARWQIDRDSVGSYDPFDPVLATYLGATELIQSEHQEIRDAASTVVGGESNPYLKAKLLFDFTVEHMEGAGSTNDALGAYRTRHGQCGGYSHLFIALCRAVGVPARPVTGIVGLRPGEHHCADGDVWTHMWTEVYLPNYGWVPVDPTVADMNGIDTFGVSFGDRLILSKGSDIELRHGFPGGVPWFHMPYVNSHQEENEDVVLIVEVLGN